MKEIKVKTFDSLGCTILSTALFQSLREKFPESKIIAYTKFPELLCDLEELNDIREPDTSDYYDVNLGNYLSNRPHYTEPYRHLSVHMIELAEEQLSQELGKNYKPKIKLSKTELGDAEDIVCETRETYGKPVVWLQTESTSANKTWPEKYLKELTLKFSSDYVFLDLSRKYFKPRISIALSKFCDAGITVDSFMLHGSMAAGAKNVIALLGSSRPEVVTYPDQTVLYKEVCEEQPCGMHKGYLITNKDYGIFRGHEETGCITDNFMCMASVSVGDVMKNLTKLVPYR